MLKPFLKSVVEVSFDSMEFMLVSLPSVERSGYSCPGKLLSWNVSKKISGDYPGWGGVGGGCRGDPCWGTGAGGGMQDDL